MSVELTAQQVAEIYGKTKQTVQNWVGAGMPVKHKGGRGKASIFDSVDVFNWLVEREIASRVVDHDGPETFDKVVEEARLRHYQANREVLREQKERGELIPTDEAITIYGELVANAKAKFLRLPEAVPKKYRTKLEKAVRAALYELSTPEAAISE